MFLRLFIDDSVMPLKKLNIEVSWWVRSSTFMDWVE